MTIDHARGNQLTLRWLLSDGHGNLVRLMAPDYTLSSWQWRGVWGEVQSSLGTGRGYCANLGHPEDETGLVYMRARYYEPATGRFLSEDPARDGVNWYLYADGNPVVKSDPTGRFTLLDFLENEYNEARIRLREMLAAQQVQNWAERKILQVLWKWAEKWELVTWEELGFASEEGAIELVGVTMRGQTFRIFFHIGEKARHVIRGGGLQPPHLQLWIDGVGNVEWQSILALLGM